MRALILAAGAALALTACSGNGAEDNNMAVDNLTVDNLVIDNTTAMDANMDMNMDANLATRNVSNDMNAVDTNATTNNAM